MTITVHPVPKACIVQTARDVVANPHPDHTLAQRLYAWCVLMGQRGKRVNQIRLHQIQRTGPSLVSP